MSKRLFTLKKTARILVSSKNNTNNSNNTDYEKDILIIQQTEQGFHNFINFNNHDQRHNLQQHHSTAITFNYSNYPYSQNSKPSFTYMEPFAAIILPIFAQAC